MSESMSCSRRNFINAPPDASQLQVLPSPGFIGSAVPQPGLPMGDFEPPVCRRDGCSGLEHHLLGFCSPYTSTCAASRHCCHRNPPEKAPGSVCAEIQGWDAGGSGASWAVTTESPNILILKSPTLHPVPKPKPSALSSPASKARPCSAAL